MTHRLKKWKYYTIPRLGDGSVTEKWPRIMEYAYGEIREILDRPWWNRVWITQEAIMAREIFLLCGEERIERESIAKWVDTGDCLAVDFMSRIIGNQCGLPNHPDWGRPSRKFESIARFRRAYQEQGKSKWLELMWEFRHQQCKDGCDRIYGYLGLACDSADLGIVPNYTLSIEEVCTEFAAPLYSTPARWMSCTASASGEAPRPFLQFFCL